MSEEKKNESSEQVSWEYAPVCNEWKEEVHERKPVPADGKDRLFAVIYLLVGYGFVHTFTTSEWNLPVFTAAYAAVVYAYLFSKGKKPAAESYFWAVIMLGIGIPYPFWTVMPFFQLCVLICVAAYWTLSVSGRLMDQGKTSHWVVYDFWNAAVVVPFGNFTCQFRAAAGGDEDNRGEDKKEKRKNLLGAALGVLAAVPALCIILPLLSSADAGFAGIIMRGTRYLTENFMITVVRILCSIPISAYLFGLIYGGISGRNTDRIDRNKIRQSGEDARIIPDVSVYTAGGIICMVYVLFIWLQGKYLFSAFAGIRPEGFTYAEYARKGFFELCLTAAFNLLILLAMGLFSETKKEKNPGLRVVNVMLSILTLLLIATAVSKMAMYITVYGLTVKRVLTMVFMIWLIIVFTAEILHQWKKFPMIRICVMTGAILYTLLCILPVENWILEYNK